MASFSRIKDNYDKKEMISSLNISGLGLWYLFLSHICKFAAVPLMSVTLIKIIRRKPWQKYEGSCQTNWIVRLQLKFWHEFGRIDLLKTRAYTQNALKF